MIFPATEYLKKKKTINENVFVKIKCYLFYKVKPLIIRDSLSNTLDQSWFSSKIKSRFDKIILSK
ncbi:hypothetical protein BpHYR1_014645 [Brachionus plicatilis]|uniref:Uncharacterized protein n=1 Tax=Brachionus plicatilis TaxID=10195 RepID=A0A3M7R3L1_BRAPC|nr:hypothetical protein BpHYR1_014645 [Brachionus plicatilis]